MPNIASVLKAEIARLARKEPRLETNGLRKAVTGYRSEIAALKRRIEQLERQTRRTSKAAISVGKPMEDDAGSPKHRFSAKGFAMHRARLGLSAAEYGRLLGVSGLSVYKWEGGQVHPRASYLPAIATVRKMGKREAASKLEALQA
ncbi:hypothetical protein GCM10027034_37520 [Ramlibacter solisilvae]|uniref:XRE family transcriptional regulator n=1 Tax=Ramlibacter tataouinensis TaxID=94132 RepID=A0A127JUQ4_9BURK|nr:helix-turn-helix domain-containing protein [Ramlibacter tataouinensis]AMO23671.1 XRE family transcriptional regulator [Ramlibacter tataouinensis]